VISGVTANTVYPAGTTLSISLTVTDNTALAGWSYSLSKAGVGVVISSSNATSSTLAVIALPSVSTTGNLTLVVSANDAAGNTLLQTVTFTIQAATPSVVSDTVTPTILSVKLDNKTIVLSDYASARPTVNITATDNVGIVAWRVMACDSNGATVAGSDTGLISVASTTSLTLASLLGPTLTQGSSYTILVRVVDADGNTGTLRTALFTVQTASDLMLSNVLAAPNPFAPNQGQTSTIGYSLNKAATVTLYIHSINGDRLYTTSQSGSTGYNQFVWDGRDQWGETVANGGYLGYLIANDGGGDKKALVKIAVLKR
jgi:hypothetical protein